MMAYEVHVLYNGYSKSNENGMEANCTCTLIKGKFNVIVDTMTAWDGDLILEGLKKYGVKPEDVQYVISTHGHSDHLGNNHLFLNAIHIVGHCISKKNQYFDEPFSTGGNYVIDKEDLLVIPTPGHTLSDVSVLVKTEQGIVAITGDLFEKEEDIGNEYIWLSAGSESPALQRYHRQYIIRHASYIIPGHGPLFQVTEEIKKSFFAHK